MYFSVDNEFCSTTIILGWSEYMSTPNMLLMVNKPVVSWAIRQYITEHE